MIQSNSSTNRGSFLGEGESTGNDRVIIGAAKSFSQSNTVQLPHLVSRTNTEVDLGYFYF